MPGSPTEKINPFATPAERRFGGNWKILIPFVFLPLIIVSGAVGIFLLFGKLADRQMTPDDYLSEIRSGSGHKRWQAAFELSRHLARGETGENKLRFERELLSVYQRSKPEETELRRYVTLALAQVGSKESVPSLEETVRSDPQNENRIYAIWALGRIGSESSAGLIAEQTRSDDAGIRKTAAFSLGFTGSAKDIPVLEKLLDDGERDVRWNAALGLAQLGSPAGKSELLTLIDAAALKAATPNLRDAERTEIMISGVNAAGRLRLREAKEKLETLAREASDARLKTAAANAAQLTEENRP